jgi:hypothetical protein
MSVSAICSSAQDKSIYRMMLDGCYAVIDSYNILQSMAVQSEPNVGGPGIVRFSEQNDSSICTLTYRKEIIALLMFHQIWYFE